MPITLNDFLQGNNNDKLKIKDGRLVASTGHAIFHRDNTRRQKSITVINKLQELLCNLTKDIVLQNQIIGKLSELRNRYSTNHPQIMRHECISIINDFIKQANKLKLTNLKNELCNKANPITQEVITKHFKRLISRNSYKSVLTQEECQELSRGFDEPIDCIDILEHANQFNPKTVGPYAINDYINNYLTKFYKQRQAQNSQGIRHEVFNKQIGRYNKTDHKAQNKYRFANLLDKTNQLIDFKINAAIAAKYTFFEYHMSDLPHKPNEFDYIKPTDIVTNQEYEDSQQTYFKKDKENIHTLSKIFRPPFPVTGGLLNEESTLNLFITCVVVWMIAKAIEANIMKPLLYVKKSNHLMGRLDYTLLFHYRKPLHTDWNNNEYNTHLLAYLVNHPDSNKNNIEIFKKNNKDMSILIDFANSFSNTTVNNWRLSFLKCNMIPQDLKAKLENINLQMIKNYLPEYNYDLFLNRYNSLIN